MNTKDILPTTEAPKTTGEEQKATSAPEPIDTTGLPEEVAAKIKALEEKVKALEARKVRKAPRPLYFAEGPPEGEKENLSQFLRRYLMETNEEGVCRHTNEEIFEAAKAAFPDWQSEGRRWYVSWYRFDLRRKGEKVPDGPKKVKAEGKAARPRKTAEDKANDLKALDNFIDKYVPVIPTDRVIGKPRKAKK